MKFQPRTILIPIGPSIAYVPLTQGQFAIVDESDHEELGGHNWYALWAPRTRSFYAVRDVRGSDGKRRVLGMHRHILGLDFGDKVQGDHLSGVTLDNRRGNLRVATHAENTRNQRKRRDNMSGYKGVYSSKTTGLWRAQIVASGKWIHLDYYPTPELAHQAYCAASAEHHGEFRRLA